jgi:peptidoglycan-associated lipoprotein
MTMLAKVLMVVAGLALAACSNPDRFGSGAGAMGPGGAGGIDQMGLGDPNNPSSIAYFNQTVGDRVFFAVDQHTLSQDAQMTLSQQAQWLNRNQGYQIIIEGHADEQGTREYNIALSGRRANAVVEYLISQGISPNRMRPIPYGKERPVAVCSSEECYRQNRRAVTVITQGIGS